MLSWFTVIHDVVVVVAVVVALIIFACESLERRREEPREHKNEMEMETSGPGAEETGQTGSA